MSSPFIVSGLPPHPIYNGSSGLSPSPLPAVKMMMNRFLKYASTILLLGSATAHAGLYLEPYYGYAKAHTTFDVPPAITSSVGVSGSTVYDNSGSIYGGRAGWEFGPAYVAYDHSVLQGKAVVIQQPQGSPQPDQAGLTATVNGVAFGLASTYIRAFATYAYQFDGVMKWADPSLSPDPHYKGNGYKVGVGITPVSYLAINFEYWNGQFRTFKTGDTTGTFDESGTARNVHIQVYLMSVSVPLEISWP